MTGSPATAIPKSIRPLKGALLLLLSFIVLANTYADENRNQTDFTGGAEATFSMKVENDGSVHNLFDELGVWAHLEISEYTKAFARLDVPGLMGYDAGWTSGAEGTVFSDDGFDRTEAYISSDVLEQAGGDPAATLNLRTGYGAQQHVLVQEFTRYRYERSSTSGIDGFDFATSVRLADRFTFTGALNPASFGEGSETSHPDGFGAFFMENDHRGVSWGESIHFIESSMQLFYDSHSNLSNNRLYDDLPHGESMTLGIGGTLSLEFAGIGIFGFGMTEFFLMYDRGNDDILQAQWGAGFDLPLLSGMEANLSGSNAMVFSDDGEGSYMNFGLDIRLLITDIFGLFGATAVTGILDDEGVSAEGGFCLVFDFFELYTGYSHHAIFGAPKYAKGAFDKVEYREGEAPGGGFFLSLETAF